MDNLINRLIYESLSVTYWKFIACILSSLLVSGVATHIYDRFTLHPNCPIVAPAPVVICPKPIQCPTSSFHPRRWKPTPYNDGQKF